MSNGSGLFGNQGPVKPHLVVGKTGVAGEVNDLRRDIGSVMAGLAAFTVDEWTNPAAADADAIKASIASSASIATYTGSALDGAVGAGVMSPPRNITITTTSDADIDAVDVVITGIDLNDQELVDTITLTDAGNTTDVGTACFKSVTSIVIPAQSGTGGALTFGFGNAIGLSKSLKSRAGLSSLTREIVGGALIDELIVEEFTDLATADVDAIVETARATSASIDTLSGPTIMDGTVGEGTMSPPRNVTITSDTHADFDAVVVVVTGTDIYGNTITDNITLTDGGNATDAGTVAFATVVSLVVPAQGGTNGTYTVGFGVVVGLKAPLKFVNSDPQVLSENEAGTPKGVDVLAGTYAAPATTAPCGTVTHGSAPDASKDYGLVYVAAKGALATAAAAAPNGSYTPVSPPLGGADVAVYYEYDPVAA